MITFQQAYEKLEKINQAHLLKYWEDLNNTEQQDLLQQISELDTDQYLSQRLLLEKSQINLKYSYEPFQSYYFAGDDENKVLGREIVAKGQLGCIVVAGGQGTRLGFDGPKGLFPISNVMQKTLFQLVAEKLKAASQQAGVLLKLAIMTAPHNDVITRNYFKSNNYFGVDSTQIFFYCQHELPLLDEEGNLFLDSKHIIAKGPDGNGSSLSEFVNSGIALKWKEQGIEHVNFIMIDNPLADPFDSEVVGFHARLGNDITIKCIERNNEEEKVGIIVQENTKAHVIEYSEISVEEKKAKINGVLKHRLANISLFCLNMDFILNVKQKLPFHLAHKAIPYIDQQGIRQSPQFPNAWKFERFIFDMLSLADKVQAYVYDRHLCYAPLKNKTGPDSPETVQEALLNADKAQVKTITGLEAPKHCFELSQEWHYPTEYIKQAWLHKELPREHYITP